MHQPHKEQEIYNQASNEGVRRVDEDVGPREVHCFSLHFSGTQQRSSAMLTRDHTGIGQYYQSC